ncbi:MAG: hypothetical protein IKX03_04700, partial [Bacteroidales bacterium]|nr:hypothetical protein [Bacteroidales bacterium]
SAAQNEKTINFFILLIIVIAFEALKVEKFIVFLQDKSQDAISSGTCATLGAITDEPAREEKAGFLFRAGRRKRQRRNGRGLRSGRGRAERDGSRRIWLLRQTA